ncbi:MAG: hypothetical protein Ct9H300mP1_17010 [Planctomycetaceae bacterium]|nr:MAG: hypothetical protein Ct9H300mP1_17010 [Planctomycetaceae bacterium]
MPDVPSDQPSDSGRRRGLVTRVLERFPEASRRPLLCESAYNVGNGAYYSLNLLVPVVLETILNGTVLHLAVFWSVAHGRACSVRSSDSPPGFVPMKLLVFVPNIVTVTCLLGVTFNPTTFDNATWFTIVMAAAFVFRVFPRTGEMNMYRVLYPTTHRGAAVGILKAIMAVAALLITAAGYLWFNYQESLYWVLFLAGAALLLAGSLFYGAIPVRPDDSMAVTGSGSSLVAFARGLKVFFTDRRFLLYQIGFSFAGTANHMVFWMVPNLCTKYLGLGDEGTRFISALMPALLVTFSAPFWGRYLDPGQPDDRSCHVQRAARDRVRVFAVGGLTGMVWLVVIAALLHGVSAGGSAVNWLTGSLHFAGRDRVSLYNAIHVGLTGLRGFVAPLVGVVLYESGALGHGDLTVTGLSLGPHTFWVASGLSFLGAVTMFWQGVPTPDPG